MDIRRVQVTGGSSYIVTLPKHWIQSLSIHKNDPLHMYVQADGSLLLTPRLEQERLQRVKVVNPRETAKPVHLLQRLIGAYIAGYTTIKITSPSRLTVDDRNVIRSFTQLAIGPEVIEETEISVTLKDLLNPTEMPIEGTIRRMHVIVKGMHEDAMRALSSNDAALAEDVGSRDNEVDRLHWLVARQYNMILQNVSIAIKMSMTADKASTCFLIGRIIERIGDHVVRIAQNVPMLTAAGLDQRVIVEILRASDLALDIFNKSVAAFFTGNLAASHEVIGMVSDLEKRCEAITTLVLKQKGSIALSVGAIVESTRRIGEYAEDISENVINYLVGSE